MAWWQSQGLVDRWARASHESAVANARTAATELSRGRVERDQVELFLAQHRAASAAPTTEVRRAAGR